MVELEKALAKGDSISYQGMQDTGRFPGGQGQDTDEFQGGGGSEQSPMRDNPENLPATSSSILTGGHVPIAEMGLVPFTHSNQYDVPCLQDIHFDPKMKSITQRMEKTLKVGAQPVVTTVTERKVMKNVEEHPKELDSMGIANAYANSHNVDMPMENIEQYKGNMAEMKEVLRKQAKVGRESKRKYEATLTEFERIQQRHHILETEWDSLKSSNEELSKEKGSLENKVAELELQKTTAEGKAKHYETQVAALETEKDSLEVSLK